MARIHPKTANIPVRVIITSENDVPERLKNRHYVVNDSGFSITAYCWTHQEALTLRDALIAEGYSASV